MSAVSTHRVRFSPGSGTALVSATFVVLVDAAADDGLVAELAERLHDGLDAGVVAEVLAGRGIRSLPAFGLVLSEESSTRVLVRGSVDVQAVLGDEVRAIDGRDVTSWTETVLHGCDRVTLRLPQGDQTTEHAYSVDAGVVPCRAMTFVSGTTASTDEVVRPAPPPTATAPTDGAVATAVPVSDEPAAPEEAPVSGGGWSLSPLPPLLGEASASAPQQPAAASEADPTPAVEDSSLTRSDAPEEDPEEEASEESVDPATTEEVTETDEGVWVPDDEDLSFGHLLGHTQYRGIEAAAVRDEEKPDAALATDDGAAVEPEPSSSADGTETLAFFEEPPEPGPAVDPENDRAVPMTSPAVQPPPPPTGTLISSVPGFSKNTGQAEAPPAPPAKAPLRPVRKVKADAPPAAAPAPAVTSDLDDDEEGQHTIVRGRLVAAAADGPLVQAVHCDQGHANPVHSSTCRSCGGAIGDRTVTRVPRPNLGELVFDTGMRVQLDRGAVLGRKPKAASDPGAHLVTLPDPESALSRSHAEIRIEDWQVQVVDLGSTNHTYVEIPGEAPVRLMANEPCVIVPGTKVNLGDCVTFTFEVE